MVSYFSTRYWTIAIDYSFHQYSLWWKRIRLNLPPREQNHHYCDQQSLVSDRSGWGLWMELSSPRTCQGELYCTPIQVLLGRLRLSMDSESLEMLRWEVRYCSRWLTDLLRTDRVEIYWFSSGHCHRACDAFEFRLLQQFNSCDIFSSQRNVQVKFLGKSRWLVKRNYENVGAMARFIRETSS